MVGVGSAVLVLVLHAQGAGLAPSWPERLSSAHSHNDQEQAEPLALALAAGFASVEADVWWRRGRIVVAHSPFEDRGSLDDLYLRPLQARVDRLGSVHGDGRPFWLWIDLKEGSRAMVEGLAAALARYPMLTVFTEAGVLPGAVTVVLTGDDGAKRRYVADRTVRHACRDAEELEAEDGAADRRFTWYSLPWSHLVREEPSDVGFRAALVRMREVVAGIHALGRRVRLYDVPERPEAWSAALAAGVDLVGTDRIEAFHDWLVQEGRPWRAPGRAAPAVAAAPRIE